LYRIKIDINELNIFYLGALPEIPLDKNTILRKDLVKKLTVREVGNEQ